METVNAGSRTKIRAQLVAVGVIAVVLLGAVVGVVSWAGSPGGEVLTQNLAEPLGDVTTAALNIDPGDGNLTVDWLTGGEQLLASGTLEYLEDSGLPAQSLTTFGSQATFTLEANSGQPWLNLPWAACNGATNWHIHLSPNVLYALTAHSDGGNIRLDLAGLSVSRVTADTGGGNMSVVLPASAANLDVSAITGAGEVTVEIGSGSTGSGAINASSGAGNVVVRLPDGLAARIKTSSGLGKTIIDPQFSKIDDTTYQSPGYDSAVNKVEITLSSGAGNVRVETR